MKQILLTLCLFAIEFAQGQSNLSAKWLRHTCGYTNGTNLLGGNVWGDAVCADKFGNSYNAGSFSGNWFTMDTVIEMNTNRFYINKYNAAGKRVWTAKAGGTTINSIMTASRMNCDSLGYVYICGTFSVDDSAYMAPNWYPVGSGYIAKYDSSGNNIWCRYIPRTGTTSVSFTDMALVNSKIYICGNMGYGLQTFGSFNFNSSKSQNGVIAKLDLNGNILAAQQLDTGSVNEIYGIEVSKKTNEIFIVGQHIFSELSVNGKKLTYTSDANNSFIIKLDNSFNALWLKKCVTYLHINQTTGSSIPCLKRIELDMNNNIYTVASGNGDSTVIGTLKFNHRISPNGSYAQDVYLVKLNSNGQELWIRSGGSDEMDEVTDMSTDEWGNTTLSVFSGFQSLSGFIFNTDTIQQWYGGLVKYDRHGNLLYAKKLQEARSLRALALGQDSVLYGTGNGFTTGMPYLNLSITQCEDQINGYNNPPYKMVMVKFFDNSGNFTNSLKKEQSLNYPIYIFPNPANKCLNVLFTEDNSNIKEIRIFDQTGKEVFHSFVFSNTIIDLENYTSGVYYIKITENEMTKISKFIKQ